MCCLHNEAVPGIPTCDGTALAGTARPRRPTEGQIGASIRPARTHGPMHNGERQHGSLMVCYSTLASMTVDPYSGVSVPASLRPHGKVEMVEKHQ